MKTIAYRQRSAVLHEITVEHDGKVATGRGISAAAAREDCARQLGLVPVPVEVDPEDLAPASRLPSRAVPRRRGRDGKVRRR